MSVFEIEKITFELIKLKLSALFLQCSCVRKRVLETMKINLCRNKINGVHEFSLLVTVFVLLF